MPDPLTTLAEVTEYGRCKCGRHVNRIQNSTHPTCRRDGMRYVYANRADTGWCIFKCEDCGSVIEDSWSPLPAGSVPQTGGTRG